MIDVELQYKGKGNDVNYIDTVKCKTKGNVNDQKKAKKEEEKDEVPAVEEEDGSASVILARCSGDEPPRRKVQRDAVANEDENVFIGEPVPEVEARQRWPHRYQQDELEDIILAKCHFTRLKVDDQIYCLEDDAYVKAAENEENYICKIVEMFEAVDGTRYFTAQWFYRAKDTVIKTHDNFIDRRRVFLSELKDDNPIDCLVQKLNLHRLTPNANSDFTSVQVECDFYYDMMYLLPYSTFISLPPDITAEAVSESDSTISCENDTAESKGRALEKTLLDLYSGCGAMSTGLCLGADNYGVKLVTKWAVDFNKHACDSLRLNHPETQVRNEPADDFLCLLREWERLCVSCSLIKSNSLPHPCLNLANHNNGESDNSHEEDDEEPRSDTDDEIYEVELILDVCFGDLNETGKSGLYFKIRWKGYDAAADTWEPIEGLSDCQHKLKEFVENGFKAKILPLPGDIDVICGGPPCQGISGFNRFRKTENPLEDPKNKQLEVFMDIVKFLKPRFVLMENVVDIVKFSHGFLGRYALGRLVGMNYQARLGIMAAGAYGLPQFRMRVFMWGALPGEKLPQYPLPTHNVVLRGSVPTEFESNTVAYDEGHGTRVKKALFLGDAISDLPPVENDESRDEREYVDEPKSGFQKFIRLGRDGMPGCILYDHCPLQLNEDDYTRVCNIPKLKGANFRDLTGVLVRDNKVEWDPKVERVYLPSGKPLVPDYAMTFSGGTSSEPFARLWWDETVPTVVTRAQPHNRAILHPEQDRVLTVRENARLQGFPDYYKLCGPIKERYIQVGNAVAVPVARALGYSLAMAFKGQSGTQPLLRLPEGFPEAFVPANQTLSEASR
nr:DNA (cytosine-5)-methyltransferase CMT3-like [Ipomoea batatas]